MVRQQRHLRHDLLGRVKQHRQRIALQAPSATFSEAGLAQLRLPTPDYAAPSQRDILRAVAFIDQHVQAAVVSRAIVSITSTCMYMLTMPPRLRELHVHTYVHCIYIRVYAVYMQCTYVCSLRTLHIHYAGGQSCLRALQWRQGALGGVHAGVPYLAGQ